MAGHDLTLGTGGQFPDWEPNPTRALGPFGGGGFLLLKVASNADLPWAGVTNLCAFSIVWYLRLLLLPGTNAWVFRMTSTVGGELTVQVLATGAVQVSRNTALGPVTVTSAPLSTLTDYVLAYTNGALAGDEARLYVNAGTPVTAMLPADVPAFGSQPRFYWGAPGGGFTSGTGVPGIIGRTRVYDGQITGAEITTEQAAYKLIYPGLP